MAASALTPTAVSPALANALAAERGRLNARVAEMRHRQAKFDSAALSAFVLTGVDTVARSVEAVAPQNTVAAVRDAFDVALTLVAQGAVGPGARTDMVERAWLSIVPVCGKLVAERPIEVLGLISNAVLSIAAVAGARPGHWIDEMVRLAPEAETSLQLRVLGQVAAWRAGLAQYRRSAIAAADELPTALALMATGATRQDSATTEQAWPVVRDALLSNPWFQLAGEHLASQQNGFDVGDFAGFGGGFLQPPQVRAMSEGFVVCSADRFYLLMVDAHGAVLLPSSSQEFDHAQAGRDVQVNKSNMQPHEAFVAIGLREVHVDWPAEGLSVSENDHTAVVSSVYSHKLRVFAKQ